MIGKAIDKVKEILEDTGLIRRVEFSDIDEFLTYKTNFFPAAHIDVTAVTANEYALKATFSIILADTTDEQENGQQNKADTLQDSLDITLTTAARLISALKSLEPEDGFRMVQDADASLERVYEQGEQDYYGWVVNFDISIPNTAHNA